MLESSSSGRTNYLYSTYLEQRYEPATGDFCPEEACGSIQLAVLLQAFSLRRLSHQLGSDIFLDRRSGMPGVSFRDEKLPTQLHVGHA